MNMKIQDLPWQDERQIPEMQRFELNRSQRRAIKAAGQKLAYNAAGPFDDFIRESKRAMMNYLPDSVLDSLALVGQDAFCPPAIVIDGLPWDLVKYGPTDPDGVTGCKEGCLSEMIVLGLAGLIGNCYGISYTGSGLVSNLFAHPDFMKKDSGLSGTDLGPHIENAGARSEWLDQAPDALVLTGVSAEPEDNPSTPIFDARLAFLRLKARAPELAERLLEKRYLVRVPQRWWDALGGAERRGRLLTGHPSSPSFGFALYAGLTRAIDPESELALEAFRLSLNEVAKPVFVTPGRACIVDNCVSMHGRSDFVPSFDEGRPLRWIQRTFVKKNLKNFAGWLKQGPVYSPTPHLAD